MIFPIGDDNSDRSTTPYVNYLFLLLNVVVFLLFQGFGQNGEFTYAWSTVPREILTGQDIVTADRVFRDPISGDPYRVPGLQPTPGSVYLTLLTSMFMHGGVAHLFGNMLYLWIFGDNIEDDLGHLRYALFYLLCGVLASMAHVLTNTGSLIPSLGASGAISAVLGGYILLHPRRKVHALVLRGFVTQVPAWAAIGLWFVFQLISGLGMLGGGTQAGGVAYAAHIGGFVAGLALVKLFAVGRPGRPRPAPQTFGRY